MGFERFNRRAGVLCCLLFFLTVAAVSAGDRARGREGREEAAAAVQRARSGMADAVSYLKGYPELFPPAGQKEALLPDRTQRLALWQAWQTFLDHLLAFDRLNEEGFDRFRRAEGEAKKEAFRVAYAGFLAQYRQALDFIALAERNRAMHIALNEEVPEIGLPAGSYARLKLRFLNLLRGAEFGRLDLVYGLYGADPKLPLTPGLEDDRQALWLAGVGPGPQLTAENALRIVQDAALASWFPVQKGVSAWMGDTRVRRPGTALISGEQIAALRPRLEPGDVLLVRREWYLSNIGLPGFWPHAALYVGTPEERAAYFDDPAVRAWVRQEGVENGDLELLLRQRSPLAWEAGRRSHEPGHPARVLEAISEGVSFTSLEHAAGGDSLVALRPRLTKAAKARAILRAFNFSGRPYDFDFDFRTDAVLVCTELVAKAYAGEPGSPGLSFPEVEVLGRPVTPANEIARQFDADFDSGRQQFDLVLFLDGHEREGKAVAADLAAFRQSWRRPKWHVLVQDPPRAEN